jgi:hypothetical protein
MAHRTRYTIQGDTRWPNATVSGGTNAIASGIAVAGRRNRRSSLVAGPPCQQRQRRECDDQQRVQQQPRVDRVGPRRLIITERDQPSTSAVHARHGMIAVELHRAVLAQCVSSLGAHRQRIDRADGQQRTVITSTMT